MEGKGRSAAVSSDQQGGKREGWLINTGAQSSLMKMKSGFYFLQMENFPTCEGAFLGGCLQYIFIALVMID